MAIFQIKVDYISRNKKGKKTKGLPAKNLSYISRGTSSGIVKNSLLYIAREDKYSDRDDLIHYEEKNIPKEFEDGKDFAETMEKHSRRDARFLKKYEMSLPREFSDKENIKIAQEFCKQKFGNDYIYFLGIHNPISKSDGLPHPHLHLNVFESKLDGLEREKEKYFKNPNKKNPERGGTGVNRELSTNGYFEKFCRDWETHLNKNLVRSGYEKLDPKKDKFEIKNSTLEEEKIRGYSKAEIEKLEPKEVSKILATSEKKIHENEKRIQRLYKKNIEREVLNELSGNKLYKLDNKIRNLEMNKLNEKIPFEKRVSYLNQTDVLKEAKEKLINGHKGTEKYHRLKEKKEREKKTELRKLNAENKKLKNNVEKLIRNRPTEEIKKVKENLQWNQSKVLEKNTLKKTEKKYFSGEKTKKEKENQNKEIKNTRSKVLQTAKLITKINVLKGVGEILKDDSFENIAGAKISRATKGYERKLSQEKTFFFYDDDVKEKNQNREQKNTEKEERGEDQNHEQERGRTRSRSR